MSLKNYAEWHKIYEAQKLLESGTNRIDSMKNKGPTHFKVGVENKVSNVPNKNLEAFLKMFKGKYAKMAQRGRVSNLKGSSAEDLKNDLVKFWSPTKITDFELIPAGTSGIHLSHGSYSSAHSTVEYKLDGKWYFLTLAGGKQTGFTPSAADFEQGIAYAYNLQLKNTGTRAKALEAAGIDEEEFEVFESYVADISNKVASQMLKSGPVRYTGKEQSKTAIVGKKQVWNVAKSPPKTDLYSDKGKISLKKGGGSRLMSGTSETQYVFNAALEYFQHHNSAFLMKDMLRVVSTIDSKFTRSLKLEQSVRSIKTDAGKAWVEFRLADKKFISDVNKFANKNDIRTAKKAIEVATNHAKAEFISSGMGKRSAGWEENLIDGIPDFTAAFNDWWVGTYIKTIRKSQRINVQDVFAGTIDHVELEKNLRNIFEVEPEFLKWVIYEAATGVYKFSGQVAKLADDYSLPDAVANKLMVFNSNGIDSANSGDITPGWAKGYTSKVKTVVGFKVADGTASSSFQIISGINENASFKEGNWIDSIISEETKMFEHELYNIEEGFKEQFNKAIANVKTFVSDMWLKLEKTIANFYNKVFAKIIAQLKAFAQQGIKVFANALGITFTGNASVDIAF
jgi:hypothetical protein